MFFYEFCLLENVIGVKVDARYKLEMGKGCLSVQQLSQSCGECGRVEVANRKSNLQLLGGANLNFSGMSNLFKK